MNMSLHTDEEQVELSEFFSLFFSLCALFQEDEAREEENGRIEPVGRADSCMDHTPVRSLE